MTEQKSVKEQIRTILYRNNKEEATDLIHAKVCKVAKVLPNPYPKADYGYDGGLYKGFEDYRQAFLKELKP